MAAMNTGIASRIFPRNALSVQKHEKLMVAVLWDVTDVLSASFIRAAAITFIYAVVISFYVSREKLQSFPE